MNHDETMTGLYQVRASAIWAELRNQSIVFWLLNIYLFLEYVRPQSLYPAIDVLPYARIVLLATLFFCLLRGRLELFDHTASRLLWGYFAVLMLSSVFAISPGTALKKLPDFVAWMLVYFLIVNIVNSERRFLIVILAFLLYNFKMAQFSFRHWAAGGFGFNAWGSGGGQGWFKNSGEFGIEMCIFLPLAATFCYALYRFWPRWKRVFFLFFPVTALTGTISSSSRGALVGAAAVLVWLLLSSRHKVKALLGLALVAALVFTLVPPEQKARFATAGEDRTSITRLERWERGLEMAGKYPILGVGYGNWSVAVRKLYDVEGDLSHNIFIECVSELGYVGLAMFLALILGCFASNRQTRRLAGENRFVFYLAHGLDGALVGFLASGFFVTVLYYPYFWVNLALTAALNRIAVQAAAAEAIAEPAIETDSRPWLQKKRSPAAGLVAGADPRRCQPG